MATAHRRTRAPGRAHIAALAVVLAAAAGCSDGDGAGDGAGGGGERVAPGGSGARSTRPPLVADPCALVPVADLDRATGLRFDSTTPSRDQCTYASSQAQAAVALNLFSTAGRPAAEVVGQGSAECDAGTSTTIEDDAVAGGYACLVSGVVTVAVVSHDGIHAILTGGPPPTGARTDLLLEQLSDLLATATAES